MNILYAEKYHLLINCYDKASIDDNPNSFICRIQGIQSLLFKVLYVVMCISCSLKSLAFYTIRELH